jgi:outer membrane immunogenic protein
MKRLLLATSALVCAGPALAADIPARMPVKAPVMVPAAYSWTGCYVGAHAGYGWGRKDFSDPTGGNFAPPGAVVLDNTRGWLAGGQVGCNYQFSGSWLLGVEGEYAWANIKGDTVDPFFAGKNGPNVLSAKTDGLASATGRVGFVWDRALFYAKGGAAWAHDRYNVFLAPGIFAPAVNASGTETRFGWTVGAGVEWAVINNWSVKLEYAHYEFGTRNINLVDPANPPPVPADIKQRIDTVKVGVNYRFWSGN